MLECKKFAEENSRSLRTFDLMIGVVYNFFVTVVLFAIKSL